MQVLWKQKPRLKKPSCIPVEINEVTNSKIPSKIIDIKQKSKALRGPESIFFRKM